MGLGPAGSPGLRPREVNGWGPGVALAVGVHLMLVAALALGVRWKINNPEPVEAEVWSEVPVAAVPEQPVAPPPTPVVEPEPAPVTEKAPEAEPPPPEPIPDVVVARTPKKEVKKAKRREPVEVFETAPPKVVKKPEKKADKKPDPAPAKAELPKKTSATPAKAATTKANGVDVAAQAAAEREAQRRANLQRMMTDLGALGTSSRSAGPSAAYGGRIKARIKPNIVFTDMVSGNPLAVVEVRCAPDGRIISRKLLESSGAPTWDDAVLRAIDRTEVLPADESGRVPPVMQIEFRPKDF